MKYLQVNQKVEKEWEGPQKMAVNCREFFVREESREEAKEKNTAECSLAAFSWRSVESWNLKCSDNGS
jgi:hypothetical protein